MQDKRIGIADVMRLAHVSRWHSVRVAREQTVAEHSYLVTMLALHLAENILPEFRSDMRRELMDWCLRHDMPEVYTGDTSPVLKRLVSERVGEDLIGRIEFESCADYQRAEGRVRNTPLYVLYKIADTLEGAVFLRDEAIGEYTKSIGQRYRATAIKLFDMANEKWPEYPWLEVRDRVFYELFDVVKSETGEHAN